MQFPCCYLPGRLSLESASGSSGFKSSGKFLDGFLQFFNPLGYFFYVSLMAFFPALNFAFNAGMNAIKLTGVDPKADLILFLKSVELIASFQCFIQMTLYFSKQKSHRLTIWYEVGWNFCLVSDAGHFSYESNFSLVVQRFFCFDGSDCHKDEPRILRGVIFPCSSHRSSVSG